MVGVKTILAVLAVSLTVTSAAQAAERQAAPDLNSLLLSADAATLTDWAERYEHGSGVVRDYARAVMLYCTAGRRGDTRAAYALGWMYAMGRGVARDDALAAPWLRLAARDGDVHAQRMLERLAAAPGAAEPADVSGHRCVLPGGAVFGTPLRGASSPNNRRVTGLVRRLAPEYGLAPELVLAVIVTESNFNPKARSPVGAEGLMQLMPATARRFGVRDSWDPVENLRGGMAYLRWLIDHFDGDLTLALAGYNAGEGAVRRHGGVPPFAETRGYLRKISALVRQQGLTLGAS